MKITVVTSEYGETGGGLAFSCLRFVEMLNSIGHEVLVLSSNIDSNEITKGGYNPKLGYELAMERKLKSDENIVRNMDLIIAFGGGQNGYYSAVLASKNQVRFWVMFRGSDANLSKWNIEQSFYNKTACERADFIICLSNEIADNLKLFYNRPAKFVVIPNSAVQLNSILAQDYKLTNSILIGTGATNLNEKKGIVILLKVMAHLKKSIPEKDFTLELVGHIDEDIRSQYEALITNLNLTDKVVFLGKKSRDEFYTIQRSWDFYVQTSICEGMGNSVIDAMSLGISVALSNTGFVAEYAKDKFNEIIFSSLEPSAIASEFAQLLKLSDLRERYKTFYDSFFKAISPERILKQWQALLDKDTSLNKYIYKPESILSVSLHDVQGLEHDNITTPISVFEQFVEDVYRSGYRLCSMREYEERPSREKQCLIVCTFDDGYEGLVQNALPIMNRYNFTGTVYVCTDYFGQYNDWNYKDKIRRRHMDVSELKTLQSFGWEIGSHGLSHQSLLRLNDQEIHEQLFSSRSILEDLFGKVTSYAYPYGDFNQYIEKQVRKIYDSAFLLTQGGVFMPVDKHRIHRYYISEIYQLIKGL